MFRLIAGASLGLALVASSAEARVYCNADGTPQGCVWERTQGWGARGVGVEPGVGVGRDGAEGEMNRGGPVNRGGRR